MFRACILSVVWCFVICSRDRIVLKVLLNPNKSISQSVIKWERCKSWLMDLHLKDHIGPMCGGTFRCPLCCFERNCYVTFGTHHVPQLNSFWFGTRYLYVDTASVSLVLKTEMITNPIRMLCNFTFAVGVSCFNFTCCPIDDTTLMIGWVCVCCFSKEQTERCRRHCCSRDDCWHQPISTATWLHCRCCDVRSWSDIDMTWPSASYCRLHVLVASSSLPLPLLLV